MPLADMADCIHADCPDQDTAHQVGLRREAHQAKLVQTWGSRPAPRRGGGARWTDQDVDRANLGVCQQIVQDYLFRCLDRHRQ